MKIQVAQWDSFTASRSIAAHLVIHWCLLNLRFSGISTEQGPDLCPVLKIQNQRQIQGKQLVRVNPGISCVYTH
jgi:hypothetical protein